MEDSIGSSHSGEQQEEDNYVYLPDEQKLSFIGCDISEIPEEILEKYAENTKKLDLSFNLFRSFSELAAFPNLEEVVLDNNQIGDDAEIPSLPKLHTLMINKNWITELDSLIEKIKVSLPSLTYISLLGNKACPNQLSSPDKDDDDYQRYRYYMLHRLPDLKFIDAAPVKNTERLEATRVAQFLRVIRPEVQDDTQEAEHPSSHYTPLPGSEASPGRNNPIGTYGTSKYVYYGRHSEGNRFIRNNDL